jgi:uncharacterized protein (TIGR02996 family)
MRKSKPITPDAALKEAVHENPLDAGARLVYADWQEERGRNETAGVRRDQAARCQDHDAGCIHEAVTADLELPEDWEVAVFPVGDSGVVWVHGLEDDAAFCEAPELQAWLLELTDEGL